LKKHYYSMKNSEISLPYFTPEKWVSQSGSQEKLHDILLPGKKILPVKHKKSCFF